MDTAEAHGKRRRGSQRDVSRGVEAEVAASMGRWAAPSQRQHGGRRGRQGLGVQPQQLRGAALVTREDEDDVVGRGDHRRHACRGTGAHVCLGAVGTWRNA